MLFTKKYFGFLTVGLLVQLIFICWAQSLSAQTNFFPLGIYNYDVTGEEHSLDQGNEMALIDGLKSNYLSEMAYQAQSGMIDTCNGRTGSIRVALSHDDTTGRCYYRVYDNNPYRYNTILWRYISDNDAAHIRLDSVLIFINRVYNRYQTNHIGISAIRVAHQGYMDQQDHFEFIRRACGRIQQLFGDDVHSLVTHNIFHWDGGTSLANFFSYMDDTLDVYQHEEYPFYVHNAGADPLHPTVYAPFLGWNYQDWYIDSLILGSYDQTRNALISGQGQNPHTRLEVIIQTQREYYPATQTFVRRPSESEIWLQAFLALSRGYKGVHSYVYRTTNTGNSWGLIDERTPRQQNIDSLCYYQNNVNNYNRNPYSVVMQLYDHLSDLADDILPLTVLDAFTWTGAAHQYIQEITGDSVEGTPPNTHRTIEVAIFNQYDSKDYFMLVNRRCSRDNNGTPAFPQTITVQTNKTGQYQIRDLYSGELFVSSDGYFRNITIGPGRGRVFELRQMFGSNETWTADTVNVSSNIEVPSGRTLTINSNTTAKFYQNTRLTIKLNGILHADGVHFTSAITGTHPGYWQDVKFEWSNSNSWIRNSTIDNAVSGVNCYQSSPEISRNVIQWNTYGIYCQSNSHPNINDNYINFNTYGIYCTGTCNPYIRHNDITENDSYGVTCLNSSAPKLVGVNSNNLYGANIVCLNYNYGVLAQTNSNPNLGSQSSGYLMGYNDIYSNFSKQVYNSTSNTIQARMNYWGTTNPIPSQLFYGPIVYKPYRTTSFEGVGPTWGRATLSVPPLVQEYPNDEVQEYLEKAQTLEGEEKYEDAVAVYRYVVDNYGDTTAYGGFALARLMASRVNQGDITVEKDYLAALAKKYVQKEAGISALLWQPLVEARAKNDQLSIGLCDNLMTTYKGTDLARDAHFEKATIQLYEFNDIEAAKKTFDEFTRTYPDDPLVEHIKIILDNYTQPLAKLPKQMAQETLPMNNIPIPEKYALAQNYPNPFNPETEIRYQLPENCQVSLLVHNLLGQQIRTLVDKQQPAGFHSIRWDGKDDQGQAVTSGVYLYLMIAKEFRQVEKMLLLR